jgi:hypothetical protein
LMIHDSRINPFHTQYIKRNYRLHTHIVCTTVISTITLFHDLSELFRSRWNPLSQHVSYSFLVFYSSLCSISPARPGQMQEYDEIINQPPTMELLLLQHLPRTNHESKSNIIGVPKS